ncbi:MAG TPA: HdeD family acid-resistance protein [Candidatus Anoxymicrobiaceae bacterium]|jgi:uncharacterized membrane protein HdeD (DUF308 family)
MRVLEWKWWSVVLRGVAAAAFGIITLAWPDITRLTLAVVFGLFVFISGALEIYNAIAAKRIDEPYILMLSVGTVGVIIGLISFIWPSVTALALLYLIAIWAIVTGVFEVVIAVQLPITRMGKWLLGVAGVISVAFGIVLISRPTGGATAVIWLIGAYAILFGVLLMALGFMIWRIRQQVTSVHPT